MDRRDFLKKAGLGSIALASLSALGQVLAAPAWADDDDDDNEDERGRTNFFFVVVSKLVSGEDLVVLNGTGKFGERGVKGNGRFTHFVPTGPPPFPIVASGTWKAKKLLDFTPTSPFTYGAHSAGILEMEVTLRPTGGEPIRGVNMTVVCNIAPGGLLTPHLEGVTVTLPDGAKFEPLPTDPPFGLTVFTRRARPREDD